LLDVARDSGGYRFTFQDVVLLRGAAALESADLPARRVRSALRQLRDQLPGRPLSAVHVRAYARALELRPDHHDAHFNLSRLHEDTGDRAAALRHLRSYSQLTRTS
jgi:hypothetical protein